MPLMTIDGRGWTRLFTIVALRLGHAFLDALILRNYTIRPHAHGVAFL
jgi:hypothetical protein